MAKPSVSTENRSIQLKYYYKVSRNKKLQKVKCDCGRTVSRGNLNQHLRSEIHRNVNKKMIFVYINGTTTIGN